MDRERGETYLRFLAEAELRRTAAQPWNPTSETQVRAELPLH